MKPPKSPGRTPGSSRITPARIEDLPTVLSADQVADVLRVSRERVCALANEGTLHRLSYAKRDFLFWRDAVLRFLAEQSGGVREILEGELLPKEPT